MSRKREIHLNRKSLVIVKMQRLIFMPVHVINDLWRLSTCGIMEVELRVVRNDRKTKLLNVLE